MKLPIKKVYALAYLDEHGVERIFYVGMTKLTYAARWDQHYKAMCKGKDPKDAYFYARRVGVSKVYMIELDPEGQHSEHDWEAGCIEMGHPLQNVAGCHRS